MPESLQEAKGVVARYQFTNLGGGILHAILSDYPAESGSDVRLNEFGTVPIGALSEQPGEGVSLPYTVTIQDQSIVCTRTQQDGLVITKTFTLPASKADSNGYRLTLDVSFSNRGSKAIESKGYYLYLGSAGPIHQRDLYTYTDFDWYGNDRPWHIDVSWFNAGPLPAYPRADGLYPGLESRWLPRAFQP